MRALLRKFVFLTIASSIITTSSCRSRQDLAQSQIAATDTAEQRQRAAEFRWKRFRETVAVIYEVLQDTPGQVGDTIRETINDSQYILNVPNLPADAPVNVIRAQIAAMSKTEEGRFILRRASEYMLTRRSNELKSRLFALRGDVKNQVRVYDYFVTGTGPQAVAFVSKMTDIAPELRGAIASADSAAGGTFQEVGEAFRLNSTNRKNTGTRAKQGEGDLNFFNDLLYITDFRGEKWAPGGDIGYIANVALAHAKANPLLNTIVVNRQDSQIEGITDWPARYRITLRDRETGVEFDIFSNYFVDTTGIGKAVPPNDAGPETLRVIEENRRVAAGAPNWEAPDVQFFQEGIERAGQSRFPLRPYIEKNVLVVGPGDSGNVITELLMRLGPSTAYQADVAQTGDPKVVYWLVGDKFEDCKTYLDQARSRYSAINSALNSGKLIPLSGKLSDLVKVGTGEYRFSWKAKDLTYSVGDIAYYAGANDPAVKDKSFSQQGNRRRVTETRISVNKIILATGFESSVGESLKDIIRRPGLSGKELENAIEVEDVRGKPAGFDREVRIAFRYKSSTGVRQNAFSAGPATVAFGGLPEQDELAGVNANKVSLFALKGRTEQLAVNIAEEILSSNTMVGGEELELVLEVKLERDPSVNRAVKEVYQKRLVLSGNPELEVKAQLAQVLSFLDAGLDKKRFTIKAEPTFGPDGSIQSIMLLTNPPLTEASAKEFGKAMRLSGVVDLLGSYFDSVRGRVGSVEIDVPDVPKPVVDVKGARDLVDFINMVPRKVKISETFQIVEGFKPFDFSQEAPAKFEPTSRGNLSEAKSQSGLKFDENRLIAVGDKVFAGGVEKIVAELVYDAGTGKAQEIVTRDGFAYQVADLTIVPTRPGDLVRKLGVQETNGNLYVVVDVRAEAGSEFFVAKNLQTGQTERINAAESASVNLRGFDFAFVNGELSSIQEFTQGGSRVTGLLDPKDGLSKKITDFPAGAVNLLVKSKFINGRRYDAGSPVIFNQTQTAINYLTADGRILLVPVPGTPFDPANPFLDVTDPRLKISVNKYDSYELGLYVKVGGQPQIISMIYSDGTILLSNGASFDAKVKPFPVEVAESKALRGRSLALEVGQNATLQAIFSDGTAAVNTSQNLVFGQAGANIAIINRLDIKLDTECVSLLKKYEAKVPSP